MTNLTEFGKSIVAIFSVIAAFIAEGLGGNDAILILLFWLTIFDYVSGVVVATKKKKLSSQIGMLGIAKKLSIFVLVFVGHRLDVAIGTMFLRNMILFFFISNEGISLLENTSALGVPYPPKLREVLAQLKEESGKKEEKK